MPCCTFDKTQTEDNMCILEACNPQDTFGLDQHAQILIFQKYCNETKECPFDARPEVWRDDEHAPMGAPVT